MYTSVGFPPVNVVDFCGQNIQGDGMIVNSHQESKKYYFVTMGTDCHFTMQAASSKDKVPTTNRTQPPPPFLCSLHMYAQYPKSTPSHRS